MKTISTFLYLILSFFVMQLQAADPCPQKAVNLPAGSSLQSAEIMSCMAKRESYKCEQLESELEASDINKIIKCDKKSLEENSLSNTSLKDCVWNGIKLSGETLLDLSKIPGKLAESIAKGFSETQACNKSVEKKREILSAFNKSIDDPRYRLEERFLGTYFEDAPCSEIEKLLSARYQGYQQALYRDRINAINAGKKVEVLKSNEGESLSKLLNDAINSLGQSFHCYTPKVKAEMLCVGITTLITDAITGGGVLMAAKKMSAVVKSKRALSRIEDAINDGRPIDLSDSSKLLAGDRLKAARELLGLKRPLMDSEKRAILEAHEIGAKEGRGFFTYTQEDIAKKARLLREAGFGKEQVRQLMESGVTGNNPVDKEKAAWTIFGHTRIPTSQFTPERKAGLLKVIDKFLEMSKTGRYSQAELEKIAMAELSQTGMSAIEIQRAVGEINRQRVVIANYLSDAPGAQVATSATTTSTTASSTASTTSSSQGVTLTSNASKPAGTTVSPQAAAKPQQSGGISSGGNSPSSSSTVSTKPTVPEFKPDPVKTQKIRAEIDANYAKDKLHTAILEDIPGVQTADDVKRIGELAGKTNPRDIETVINFTRPVKPEDVASWLKNPNGAMPDSIRKLKMVFPKLSPQNIEEVLLHGQKRTPDELTNFKKVRTERAQATLRGIFGNGDLKISETIEASSLRIRDNLKQVESWEIKMKDPKTPNYNRQGYADQAERARRTVEIEKAKCKKILDLYITAYNMPDYTKRYQGEYDQLCGSL